ncbi:SusC/RagA family TonB-linked outer membrane protein [Pedobacter sp. HMF7647]|uniref:SusC/RagA family TonB-linked outer membrane protein n=1 Tax=Hufsiella arboris TaxID=2695275 RepID=A0A7K1YES9_9SPHI|nr:TonB-dependent receptor [Hufsiella arboris]MXV52910.1 SusC/RagA family TonB-linked outer membrane protein [Hufsiella arboris]
MKIKFLQRNGRYLLKRTLCNSFFLSSLFIVSANAYAASPRNAAIESTFQKQPITVTGTVVDDKDEVMPGVSIRVKGTSTTAATDAAGKFSIAVPGNDAILQVSFIGFATQEIIVGNNKTFRIKLASDTKGLNEVVVVGYGTQRKFTVTGSVATLKSEDIVITKNENTVNMLTGKMPGLRVMQRTSEPGGYENAFDIRGFGKPLIVIDNVPRDGGDFSRMDPNEIENVTILKDASAAIYGVRAANGVILITTKKGNKTGKYDINYSVNQGWQQFLGMPDGVNAVDYMLLTNEKNKRSFANNFLGNSEPTFSYGDIEPWLNGTFPSADWIGAAFRNTSPQIQHNLNVNGGTDKANLFLNLGYMNQDGLMKSGDLNYNRWNFRANASATIVKGLKADMLLSGFQDQKNQPYQDLWTIFKYTWNQIPRNQIYANNNPLYPNVMPDNANPVMITDGDFVGTKQFNNKNFQGQASLDYEIPGTKGLKARAMYNYGYTSGDNTEHRKDYDLYTYDAGTDIYMPSNVNGPTRILRYFGNTTSNLAQLSLNYTHSFWGAHNVSGLLLYEYSHSKGDNFFAQRNINLPIDYLFGGEDANQLGSMNTGGLFEVATEAVLGRFNYDYKGKYLFEFLFREDGSNKFKPGPSQWGFFPAVSAGWRISEEKFMHNLTTSGTITNLKLRLSYGKTGDDSATAFQYISGFKYPTINPNDNSIYGYIFGGNFTNGAASSGVVNPDLTWFTATTKNIGLDFGLFKGKLDGSIDVFRRDRDGLLARRDVAVPGTVGADLPQENLNSDRTQGIDLILTHRNKLGKFGYSVSGNIGTTRSENRDVIQTMAGNQYDNWRNSQQNRYTSIWWGKVYEGQFTNYDQIYKYPVNTGGGNNNTIPGDYYYQDWNEDGVIDGKDDQPIATKDIPLVNFGLNLGLNFKGFDLNVLFQGATGFYVQYAEQYAEPLMYNRSSLTRFLDSWHTVNPNDNVFDPNTQWVPGYYPAMGSQYAQGTKAVQDATYLRIKTLELGYSLPQTLLKHVGVKRLRVYVNSYNLATFTGLKNYDPEHPGDVPDTGFDQSLGGYKYPLNRTFNLGANISF